MIHHQHITSKHIKTHIKRTLSEPLLCFDSLRSNPSQVLYCTVLSLTLNESEISNVKEDEDDMDRILLLVLPAVLLRRSMAGRAMRPSILVAADVNNMINVRSILVEREIDRDR